MTPIVASSQVSTYRLRAVRGALMSLLLLTGSLAAGCNLTSGMGEGLGLGNFALTMLRVYVFNQSKASFTLEGVDVGVGDRGFHRPFGPEVVGQEFQFDLGRGGVTVATVTYVVLKAPEKGQTQDVAILITEPSRGVFEAATPDTAFIQILSVRQ